MNRTDIVEYARRHGGGADLPRKTVREALDFVIEEITQTVLGGEAVKLTGFGTFEVRNHRVVVFRPTRHLWGARKDEEKKR